MTPRERVLAALDHLRFFGGRPLVKGALFMMVALGMGLLISTVARNQFVAGQIALVATFLPASRR